MKTILFSVLFSAGSVLAATVVDTCDEGSLRHALNEGGTVNLACDGIITLSNTLVIRTNVILSAAGHDVTLSGNGGVPVFRVNPGVDFRAFSLTIADGRGAVGGGLYNDGGSVSLQDCVLRNNRADGTNGIWPLLGAARRGAIYNATGTVRVIRSTITNNQAEGANGVSAPSQPAFGGAVYGQAGLTVCWLVIKRSAVKAV